jgi:hypothetical protein
VILVCSFGVSCVDGHVIIPHSVTQHNACNKDTVMNLLVPKNGENLAFQGYTFMHIMISMEITGM